VVILRASFDVFVATWSRCARSRRRPSSRAAPPPQASKDDRRCAAAGRERRSGAVGAVLRCARITGPVLVLVGWAALGALLALALGGRITDPVDAEASAAAGASV
jgi:hypothetical protein